MGTALCHHLRDVCQDWPLAPSSATIQLSWYSNETLQNAKTPPVPKARTQHFVLQPPQDDEAPRPGSRASKPGEEPSDSETFELQPGPLAPLFLHKASLGFFRFWRLNSWGSELLLLPPLRLFAALSERRTRALCLHRRKRSASRITQNDESCK